jgi:hypothetical protein
MPATTTYWVLSEGLMSTVLSDTLTQTAPRSTAAELRFCSTRYQECLNFQLELSTQAGVLASASGPLSASGQATAFLYCVISLCGACFLELELELY